MWIKINTSLGFWEILFKYLWLFKKNSLMAKKGIKHVLKSETKFKLYTMLHANDRARPRQRFQVSTNREPENNSFVLKVTV